MKSLSELALDLCADPEHPERPGNHMNDATWEFIETLTFADADEITTMMQETSPVPTVGLPVWARNLAYRLACLQRPDDAELLRAAGTDLYLHGPDWNEHARELLLRADELSGSSPA
ncbi:hypothetical protein [Micromonospora sp. CPCC 205556]|uniref:hypothetical protein n=1 Tax=Micromonospora sp. CPCC 205556 TaxID=3122398 RepID=UPI002FF29DC3